ncbi:hypothetical protein OJE16_07495 [Pantoea tagorei]
MQKQGRLTIVGLAFKDSYFYTLFIYKSDLCRKSQISAIKERQTLAAGHTQNAPNVVRGVFVQRDLAAAG